MGLLIGVGQTRPNFAYDYYYGIEWDTTTSNPSVTRIGKSELHASLPVQSKMRRCVVNDAGDVVYYLDANDSTKTSTGATADLSGAAGNVMVEMPEHYYRFEQDGTTCRALISTHPLPGFHHRGVQYVSAYEAVLDRTNNKLMSIVNSAAQYRGGTNTSDWDETYRSLLGRPVTGVSLTNFRAYARTGRNTDWNCNVYNIQKTLFWMFAIEYATFNSQAGHNAALDENGYHQGGLGMGVTQISDWSGYNSNNPFVPCGVTNSLGNKTGVVTYNAMKADGETIHYAAPVPSYRGVENPFGHVWKWTDGVLCNIQSAEAGGVSEFLVCEDSSKYASSITADYTKRGELPRTSGYVKTIMLGDDGDIMPLAVGGGSTTYFCDYFYTDIPASGSATRGVLFGGAASYVANAGFVYAYTANTPANTHASFGSRLCYIPQIA